MKLYTPHSGQHLLNSAMLNKDSAFTKEERERFNLAGLIPNKIETIEEQSVRLHRQYSVIKSDLEKYQFLRGIQDSNETLYYHLISHHISEMMPIIYTPTVGQASTDFSTIFRKGRGLFISIEDQDAIDNILNHVTNSQVKVIVITDGERVLGLGDLGVGGMAISIGKLALYTSCGGINPEHTLPIVVDVGTNNQRLIDDPLYLGLKQPRVSGLSYFNFMNQVIHAIAKRWPNVLIQFEDFAQANATPLLNNFKSKVCCFNDDIQGTAAVVLGCLISACRKSNTSLEDHSIVFQGAGSAGCGIAEAIIQYMGTQGIDRNEAKRKIFMVDQDGLITDNTPALYDFQARLTQKHTEIDLWPDGDRRLLDVITQSKASILIGVSGAQGTFTQAITEQMCRNSAKPIIFPLSNPTSKSEAMADDLIRWSKGTAIVATGSPVEPFSAFDTEYKIDQCNNCYIFPGVGLGVIVARAKRVTDSMMLCASQTLAEYAAEHCQNSNNILPDLESIGEVSKLIAFNVAQQAMQQNVAPYQSDEQLQRAIDDYFWRPQYQEYYRISY